MPLCVCSIKSRTMPALTLADRSLTIWLLAKMPRNNDNGRWPTHLRSSMIGLEGQIGRVEKCRPYDVIQRQIVWMNMICLLLRLLGHPSFRKIRNQKTGLTAVFPWLSPHTPRHPAAKETLAALQLRYIPKVPYLPYPADRALAVP